MNSDTIVYLLFALAQKHGFIVLDYPCLEAVGVNVTLQHGVTTAGGCNLIAHHIRIQLLLEKNPEWILLNTDVKNAFSSIRSHLLSQVA